MIAFAQVLQETDSFNPVVTTLEHFEDRRLLEGRDLLSQLDGQWLVDGLVTALSDAGQMDAFRPVFSAFAGAGGRLSDGTLEHFRRKLLDGFRGAGPDDALVVSLHGAMSSESIDDTEGYLLRELRNETGAAPFILLVLDHHANVTRETMAHVNLVVTYDTQPHDLPATGFKAAQTLLRVRAAGIRPATAWRKIPMIAPQDRFLTTCPGPMREWFDLAREQEQDPRVLAVSLYPMQPWLDVPEGGWSAVVHTDDDQALADRLADELAEKAWSLREAFWVSERVSPAEAVRPADAPGLTVISDTGDAVMGGATGDSTVLLREIVRQGIRSTVFLPMVDADAVEAAHGAGAGTRVTLTVGGGIDTTFYEPLQITGSVRAVSDGCDLETFRGHCRLGRSALIETGGARLALIDSPSRAMVDPGLYTNLGLRIEEADAVVLKTGSNFQAFAPWQKRLVRADTPGITQSRLQDFTWRKLPRPIYPFDTINDWR